MRPVRGNKDLYCFSGPCTKFTYSCSARQILMSFFSGFSVWGPMLWFALSPHQSAIHRDILPRDISARIADSQVAAAHKATTAAMALYVQHAWACTSESLQHEGWGLAVRCQRGNHMAWWDNMVRCARTVLRSKKTKESAYGTRDSHVVPHHST